MGKIPIHVDAQLSSIFPDKTFNDLCTILKDCGKEQLIEDIKFASFQELKTIEKDLPKSVNEKYRDFILSRTAEQEFYQACCNELCSTLKKKEKDFLYVSSKGWSNKINYQQKGSIYIFEEVYALREKLSAQLEVNLNGKLTLVVPTANYPYLIAKTALGISALEMIHEILPDLKVVHLPELKDLSGIFALLIYNGGEFDSSGYWVTNEQYAEYSSMKDIEHGTIQYFVTSPDVKLFIPNPKQIAVLKTRPQMTADQIEQSMACL